METQTWTSPLKINSFCKYILSPYYVPGALGHNQILTSLLENLFSEISSFSDKTSTSQWFLPQLLSLPGRVPFLGELFAVSRWEAELRWVQQGLGRDYRTISQRPEEKMLGWKKGISFIYIPVSVEELRVWGLGDWQSLREKCLFMCPPFQRSVPLCQNHTCLPKFIHHSQCSLTGA